MNKATAKNGVTGKAGAEVETSKTGNKIQETVKDVLKVIGGYCDEVVSGSRKCNSDATFFTTKKEAETVKAACESGDDGEVLLLLGRCKGEPSPRVFIARLKAAIAAQGHTATAGTGDGQVKADPRPNTENAGQQPDPVSNTGSVPEQHLDGNVEDPSGGKQMDNMDKQCDTGNAKADDPNTGDKGTGIDHGDGPQSVEPAAGAQQPIHGEDVPPAAKPASGNIKRVVKPTDDRGMKTPALSGEAPSAPSADTSHNADKAAPVNTPTAQDGNGAIKDHPDGNQGVARERQASELPEPAAIPGVEYMDPASIEIDPEASSMFERSPAVSDALRQSMKKDGFKIYHPVKAWGRDDGKCTPYDGHTRLEIAAELGITKIPVVKTRFATRKEFLDAAINEQVDRRNLSIKDKFSIVKHYAPIETENALGRHGVKSAEKSADSSTGRANAIIGRKIGYGPDIVARMRFLIEADNGELLKKVYSDEMSISSAFTTLKPKKEKLTDVGKVENGKIKPGPEQKKPIVADEAADADKGAKAPKAQEANHPCSGIPAAADSESVSTGKDETEGKPAVKAPPVATTQVIQPAIQMPTPPASQGNAAPGTYPVPEKLLALLVTFAPESSRPKIYGLLTVCPQSTRDFIKKHLSGEKEPSKRKSQSRSNPKDKLTASMSGKRKAPMLVQQPEI